MQRPEIWYLCRWKQQLKHQAGTYSLDIRSQQTAWINASHLVAFTFQLTAQPIRNPSLYPLLENTGTLCAAGIAWVQHSGRRLFLHRFCVCQKSGIYMRKQYAPSSVRLKFQKKPVSYRNVWSYYVGSHHIVWYSLAPRRYSAEIIGKEFDSLATDQSTCNENAAEGDIVITDNK